jgi:hypothetical protein
MLLVASITWKQSSPRLLSRELSWELLASVPVAGPDRWHNLQRRRRRRPATLTANLAAEVWTPYGDLMSLWQPRGRKGSHDPEYQRLRNSAGGPDIPVRLSKKAVREYFAEARADYLKIRIRRLPILVQRGCAPDLLRPAHGHLRVRQRSALAGLAVVLQGRLATCS